MHPEVAIPLATPKRFRFVFNYAYALFAALVLIILVIATAILDPSRFTGGGIAATLGTAAPLILAAIAETPVILAGGGGIDLSVGPLMGLINALLVVDVIGSAHLQSPLVIVPVVVAMGAASGLLNGFLVAGVRLQPIVATLGTYLIYSGLTLYVLPQPSGSVPSWIGSLAGQREGVPMAAVMIALVLLAWWGFTKIPVYDHLMATGSNDRTAYASGVDIFWVRITAYVVTGCIAAVAGLALTGLLSSADPTVAPSYTLTAIAAVALGGVSLAGGRGGTFGATVGALDVFLIENILTYFNVSTFALQITYGVILVFAVVLNTTLGRRWGNVGWEVH